MLRVKHVSKCFDEKLIINDISFEIESGEIVSILGNNGSGKTTTMKLLANLLEMDKGEIQLDDQDIKLKDIGYLSEERSLYYDCSIKDQLHLLASLAKIEDQQQVIEYYLKRVGLLDKQDCLICELSKGNQQKISLISSILKGPKLLLLDEPFTGLDKENVALFEKMILEYRTSKRILMISSHIFDSINKYCDRFIIIKDGMIKENITKKQLEEDEKRVLIVKGDVELKNYISYKNEGVFSKYIYENEEKALKTIKWMNSNGLTDYTYRHINIEDYLC